MRSEPLDLFDTPLALATLDGVIESANPAFRRWTSAEDVRALGAIELPLAADRRYAIKASGKTERGRAIPVEYLLRVVDRGGRPMIAVEGRDVSRVHEKEAMIESFTRTIELNNRLLHKQKDDLARAYAAVRRLLDSVDQGFATLDASGALLAERSAVFDRWFDAPAAGIAFADCLRMLDGEIAELFRLAWSQIEDAVLPLDLLVDQLPRKLHAAGRYYRFSYKPALSETGALLNLLVVMTDVTDEVERDLAEAHQRDLVALLGRFSNDRRGFREFVREADSLIATIARSSDARELERAIHTLKGNCALFGAHLVARHCHELEDRLADLGGPLDQLERRALGEVWSGLRARVALFLLEDDQGIVIGHQELDELRRRFADMSPGELIELLDTWRWEPVADRMSRIADRAQSLASRLGKGPVKAVVEAEALRFDPERWGPFWAAFAHVVRNAIDHGLEPSGERAALGKGGGWIGLRAAIVDDRVVIDLADDGAGVDWPAVADRAAALGLDTSSQDALVQALFTEGLSTRREATETSGRGVGLAAVREACQRLGGTFEVQSRRGRGTRFRFRFPLVGVALDRLGIRSGGAGPARDAAPRDVDDLDDLDVRPRALRSAR
jgi:two-component system, chemotaxis family, sensor kinase CheA